MSLLMKLSAGRQTRMPGPSGLKHRGSTPKHTPWQGGLGQSGEKGGTTELLWWLQPTGPLLTWTKNKTMVHSGSLSLAGEGPLVPTWGWSSNWFKDGHRPCFLCRKTPARSQKQFFSRETLKLFGFKYGWTWFRRTKLAYKETRAWQG